MENKVNALNNLLSELHIMFNDGAVSKEFVERTFEEMWKTVIFEEINYVAE